MDIEAVFTRSRQVSCSNKRVRSCEGLIQHRFISHLRRGQGNRTMAGAVLLHAVTQGSRFSGHIFLPLHLVLSTGASQEEKV